MLAAPTLSSTPVADVTHAVVMGDLVASEHAPGVRTLHARFNAAVGWANQSGGPEITSPLTITLGDEFQGLTATLEGGLRLIRGLRARLLADDIPCRFVLGAVRLETPVNAARAWNMMGEGLAASRRRLEDKRDPSAYRFEIPVDRAVQGLMDAIGAGLTDIETGWTERQRQIVHALQDEPAAPVAERLGVSVQTLYKIRRAGRYDLYERQWGALMAMAARLDQVLGLARP